MSTEIIPLSDFKRLAKMHRKKQSIKHSQALEEVARSLGFKDYHDYLQRAKLNRRDVKAM